MLKSKSWFIGFDDQGRQFDQHGNLVDWWSGDDTEAKFAAKAQCMVEQVIKMNTNYSNLIFH